MPGYSPVKITGFSSGLVQSRENFLLPNDAYPTLVNAYVWRERILRKKGAQLLGRLQRNIGMTDAGGNITVTINPHPIQPGITSFVIGNDVFIDPGGSSPVTLKTNSSGSGTLNRAAGVLTITGSQANTSVQYFPGLPVMGICKRELQNSTDDQTIFFDQNYAYNFNTTTNQFQEFIPGTTWNKSSQSVSGINFFFSTNYWVSSTPIFGTTNIKLMWVTNNSGSSGVNADPPRITDGSTWVDFYHDTLPATNSPWAQIDSTNFLTNFMAMLPFRGRMVVFNTWEGTNATSSLNFSNRIRWSTIGNPFIAYSNVSPATGSWRDDIRGQGGFLDIPTSEDIIAVGFVRDNLVIYCERSTWQLRYTGNSIAPFQIERVNSELGAMSTFSAVQFDTSLVGFGDKGIVECDSYKSQRIDIKIPDLIFSVNANNNGVTRVQGIRDFIRRLAYWTFPGSSESQYANSNTIFPTQRLVYNYENDSWAIFSDSYTALGNYQPTNSRTWLTTPETWLDCPFSWIGSTNGEIPLIVGGNQQGFVHILNELTVGDSSLFITNISSDGNNATVITSPNHNMQTGFVININGILGDSNYTPLNGGIYGIVVIDANTFKIFDYDSTSKNFDNPVAVPSGTYKGGGLINIRDNFSIVSKKFNFLDEGKNIQLGYIDILMGATEQNKPGAISLNIYLDYNENEATNILPLNQNSDTFFNSIIPTTSSTLNNNGGTKFWQRVYCPTRGNFLTLQYTFSNAQMAGLEQTLDFQIDAQILWLRHAGRMTQI